MRPAAFVLIVGAALAASGPPAGIAAAEASLERVVLLRSADRVSVAIEMSAEPDKVVTHDVSDTVLEIEIGPIAGPVPARELRPPDDAEQIRVVVVRQFEAGGALFVRARITLRTPAGSHVRLVGRRVYVDFAPAGQSANAALTPVALRVRDGSLKGSRHESARERSTGAPVDAYADAVHPVVARLAEMQPFLLSATSSPTPDVLAALAGSLDAVYASLHAVSVPGAFVATHGRLTTAVLTARRAVGPAFAGDRVAEAHRAMALFEAAKAEIQREPPGAP